MNIGFISTERTEPFCFFFYVLLYLYYFLDPERKTCSINYIFTIVNFFYNLNHTRKTCQWYLAPISVSCYIFTTSSDNLEKGALFMKMSSSANFFPRTSCNSADWKLSTIFSLTKFYPQFINI